MKRLLWLTTLVLAAVLSACSGGSSPVPLPPPAGGFSLSSLKGQYAFSMSGLDNSGNYLARAGSFVADGDGNISSAMEDVVDLGVGAPIEVTFAPGKYSMLANGRGVIVLQDNSGSGGLTLTMILQSSSQGYLLQTDTGINGSGTSGNFILQTTADFLASSLNGHYVFDFSGVSLTGVAPTDVSTVGYIAATGNGIITGGLNDINDGNTGVSGPVTIAPGTFALDPAYGAAFGRGTAQFAGHTFAFYIVDNTQVRCIQEDSQGGSTGDAVLQTGAIPTQNAGFTGSFAYLVGGTSPLGYPDAAVARFTADGAGGIGAISYDENNNGEPLHISQGSNISNATYAIDTTNAGSGRGTLTFTDSTSGLALQYVFYLGTPASGVIQNTTSGYVANGTMFAQTGSPFTLASLAGNYAFSWSGVSTTSVENYVGQYVLASSASNNISGVLDGTSLTFNGVASYPDSGVQGTLTINSDGSTNNTYQIAAGNSVSSAYGFQAYIVDANTVLLVGTDKTRVLAGFVSRQSQ